MELQVGLELALMAVQLITVLRHQLIPPVMLSM